MYLDQLRELTEQLYNTTPLIGGSLRRYAARELGRNYLLSAARVLAEAVTRSNDKKVRAIAVDALSELSDQHCINDVCEIWVSTRNDDLARVLKKSKLVASQPDQLRVLTALKAGLLGIVTEGGADVVEPLLRACSDKDTEISKHAWQCFVSLQNPVAIDALCLAVIADDFPMAQKAAIDTGYAPRDASQRALFYFLTGQWEKYESLDFDHSMLRAMYEASDENQQRRIAERARNAGRVELVEVVSGGQRGLRLGQMSDREWEAALAVLKARGEGEKVWKLAQVAPPRWSRRLLEGIKGREADSGGSKADELIELTDLALRCSGDLPQDWSLPVERMLSGHGCVNCLAISPDGRLLVSGSDDKTVRAWRFPDCEPLTWGAGHNESVRCLAISPDSKVLASGSQDNTVRLWSLLDGKLLRTLEGQSNYYFGFAISPDSKVLASLTNDFTVRLWSLPDGEPLHMLEGHSGFVRCLAISPDGEVLASGSSDNTVRLWSLPGGEWVQTLAGHNSYITCLAISPDGRVLASGSDDSTVRLWGLPDGKLLRTVEGHSESVRCLAISPDGKVLASGSDDSTVRLWSLPDGEPLQTLEEHSGFVLCLAISPDSRVLAIGSQKNTTVRLWNLRNGKLLQTLVGHRGSINCIAFSPYGRVLASGSDDRTVRLWTTRLSQLCCSPIISTTLEDLAWAQRTLRDDDLSDENRNWLEFIVVLMERRRRFDIGIGESHIEVGEFDIEIEG